MCKVFHSSLILHQEAGSSEPASCIFNTYKGLSQFLIETAPFLYFLGNLLSINGQTSGCS
ncbi:hypothetical protein SAMN04490355_10991 [Pelosinus propionicus DSM 13327]|uniref:Uncharacterized protein n=1 Tax=Pelosinus propionicus DSM 13327 TaxID=1123291 RepID=A0A1I4QG28_9FIRM|nr:hypothetical protein SAMN04490355_10991 [Pelosinus propionicus DSM 13327]